MRLLVYSPIPTQSLAASLGMPEYSYVFVLERFLPVLRSLGEVVPVQDPAAEADALYREAVERGEQCVLLAFAPPNRAPVGLQCPTVCVFAWEFDSLPSDVWGDEPRNDWRSVLRDHGATITLSRDTAEVVRATMGERFPVAAVPAPIYRRFAAPGPRDGADLGPRGMTFTGVSIDSRDFAAGETTLVPGSRLAEFREFEWDGRPLRLGFADTDPDRGRIVGFYRPEPWGAWSRMDSPWVLLPTAVHGRLRLTFMAAGYGLNAGRDVTVRVGGCERTFHLSGDFTEHTVDLDVPEPANTVEFSGLSVTVLDSSSDVRSMALGLCWLEIERRTPLSRVRLPAGLRRRPPQRSAAPELGEAAAPANLSVDGVVYTTVLNPADGRKNWKAIVTAFCWAFRDRPDATLVIKMTHKSMTSYFADLQFQLHRVGPVKCRVVAMHGFLSDDELRQLAGLTTVYVNASEAEGLCMPLMEFMSAGVPAIAPVHTAMLDYIAPDAAFPLRSSPFPTIWPHDPRQLWRAHKHRTHWDSLVAAYEESYEVATSDRSRYARMSTSAAQRLREFCDDDVVRDALARALPGAGG